jgi:hypothetical protein
MMDFSATITDPSQLAAIKMARDDYNAKLPNAQIATLDDKGNVISVSAAAEKPGQIDDDGAFVQLVLNSALNVLVKKFGTDVSEIDAQIASLQEKRTVVIASANARSQS